MRYSRVLPVLGLILVLVPSAWADSKEEVQIRFQIFALAGHVSGDTDLDERIWAGDRDDWERIEDVVTLFDEGYFRLGNAKLRLEDEDLFWDREKLSFVEGQRLDLPADRIRRINAPSVLLEKDKSYTIKIQSRQSFQYFRRRGDGLFELKQIDDLPTGLDIRVKPKDRDGRILFDDMRITVRAVGRREPIAGVDLPIGRPVVQENAYDLELRVRPNNTYGILLELEGGQGAVVIFFTTAAVTRPVLDTIRRELGEVAYSIERKIRDGRPAYEVDTWDGGRHIELNVYADGSLRDRRDEMELDELSDAIRQAIHRHVTGGEIENIDRVSGSQRVTYDVDVKERGDDVEYIFAEDGALLRRHDD